MALTAWSRSRRIPHDVFSSTHFTELGSGNVAEDGSFWVPSPQSTAWQIIPSGVGKERGTRWRCATFAFVFLFSFPCHDSVCLMGAPSDQPETLVDDPFKNGLLCSCGKQTVLQEKGSTHKIRCICWKCAFRSLKLPVITYLGNSLMFTFSSIWQVAFSIIFFIFSLSCCTSCGQKLNYVMKTLRTESKSRQPWNKRPTTRKAPLGGSHLAWAFGRRCQLAVPNSCHSEDTVAISHDVGCPKGSADEPDITSWGERLASCHSLSPLQPDQMSPAQ